MKEPFIFLCPEITRENALSLMKWLKDEHVRKFLSDSPEVSQNIKQAIDRVNLSVLTPLFCQNGRFYMVYDKKSETVGFVRLIPTGTDVEIVVVIGDRNKWGKKLGTRTILESMKIAFFELRAKRVIANIHKDNKRSIRAFLNVGFEAENEINNVRKYVLTMEKYIQSVKEQAAQEGAELFITEIDLDRIKTLINQEYNGKKFDKAAEDLEKELKKAVVVAPQDIPDDVITMNSRAILHMNGKDVEVSLVYPEDADWGMKKISVFSPIGTAILGYGAGKKVSWQIPTGTTEIQIKKVLYQPEAVGDYHL